MRSMLKRMIVSFIGLAVVFSNVQPLAGATGDEDAIRNLLGDFFQIYVLRKDQRSDEDKVEVKNLGNNRYSAEIAYWRSLKSRDPAEEICNSYRWLLLGRGVYGKGAPEAFSKFPSLEEISLRFFDIEFTTKLTDKRAEVIPTQRQIPYLKIGVKRGTLVRKNPNRTEIEAEITKGKCADIGEKYLDSRWFNESYLRQAK